MNFVKKNLKWIITIIGVIILTTGISVYATGQYLASRVDYTTSKNGNIKNVEEALNDLYSKISTENIIFTGANNKNSEMQSYTFLHDNDKAMIFSGQVSLMYSINSTDTQNFVAVNSNIGETTDNLGLYYCTGISVKEGDTIYFKRNTEGTYGYAVIY